MAPATAAIEAVAVTTARSERNIILGVSMEAGPGAPTVIANLDPKNEARPSDRRGEVRITANALPRFNLAAAVGIVT
jgi:hypothetical protein